MQVVSSAGPIAAFAQMQRSMRDTEKRVLDLSVEVEGLSSALEGRLSHTSRKLKAALNALGNDVERKLSGVDGAVARVRAELERVGNKQRMELEGLNEAVEAGSASVAEVRMELAELRKGGAQHADSLISLRAHVEAVEGKVAAQIQAHASEGADRGRQAAARREALGLRLDGLAEHARKELAAAVSQLEQKMLGMQRSLSSIQDGIESEINACRTQVQSVVEKCSALQRELRERSVPPLDASGGYTQLTEQMTALSKQFAPLEAAVGGLSSTANQLQTRLGAEEARSAQHSALFGECTRAMQQLASEVELLRQANSTQEQQIATLIAQERASSTAFNALETKLRHVSNLAEEQGRYLTRVSESLYAQRAVPVKYRTGAIVPDFVPPLAGGDEGHSGSPPVIASAQLASRLGQCRASPRDISPSATEDRLTRLAPAA